MERNTQSNSFVKKQNKGFTIHVGDTYVGHLVINEDRVDPATLANLQKPNMMKAILSTAELRKFVPPEERTARDTSDLDAIMAQAATPAEDASQGNTDAPADDIEEAIAQEIHQA